MYICPTAAAAVVVRLNGFINHRRRWEGWIERLEDEVEEQRKGASVENSVGFDRLEFDLKGFRREKGRRQFNEIRQGRQGKRE